MFQGKQVHIRKPALSTPEVVPERKRSTPINPANTIRKCFTNNPVSQRSFRDRIIHLLALRTYKKLEVLARLQRDGINLKDRNSLGSTLQQVLSCFFIVILLLCLSQNKSVSRWNLLRKLIFITLEQKKRHGTFIDLEKKVVYFFGCDKGTHFAERYIVPQIIATK